MYPIATMISVLRSGRATRHLESGEWLRTQTVLDLISNQLLILTNFFSHQTASRTARSLVRITLTGTLRSTLIRTKLGSFPNVRLYVMFMMRPLNARNNTFEKGVWLTVSISCCTEMMFVLPFGRCFPSDYYACTVLYISPVVSDIFIRSFSRG